MPRLSEVQARIRNLDELEKVVHALRAVSSARVRQALRVLEAVREYTSTLEAALGDAMRSLPCMKEVAPSEGGAIVIAFGSEHGFVGSINERVLERASADAGTGGDIFVVGSRAVSIAKEGGRPIAWCSSMTSNILGVDDVALEVAEALGRRPTAHVSVVYVRRSGGATLRVTSETLTPFCLSALTNGRNDSVPLLSNVRPEDLVDGLIDEMLFAQLARVATESFASENAARLQSMDAASDNIGRKLTDLRRIEHAVRQEEITKELLDVITGAEAVRDRPR